LHSAEAECKYALHGVVDWSCSVSVVMCITAVSVDELRQANCVDDAQSDDASSHCPCELDSDSEPSLSQQQVMSDDL